MADGLLNKASIILTPTGYKAGTLYNVAPVVEPYEDFDFARASVASRVNSSGLVEMVGRTLGSELVQNGDFSELGSELVTDGDFPTPNINWSLTNATIETNGARINNTVITGFSGISQLLSGTLSNKQFIITYDVVATNGQNLVLDNGTSLTLNTSTTGVGKELYFEWTRGDNYLVIKRAVADTDVTIDNVSVQQVDPNDYWTKLNATISGGKGNLDGNGVTSMLWQDILTNGNSYKATFTVADYNGSGSAKIINNNASTIYTISSDGTFTINFTHSIANGNFIFRATSGAVFSVDNVSVKEIIDTNNIPRISYDSNGDNGHILLEPTSTNLFEYSESFNTAEWNRSSITVVDNSSQSPDGTNSASLMYPSSSGNFRYLHNSTIASSSKYTISAFVKASGKNVVWMYINSSSQNGLIYYDLSDQTTQVVSGSVGTPTATIESYNNDWYKISYTLGTGVILNGGSGLGVSDAKGDAAVTVNGTDGILVWGLQLEALSYATSYIPTLTGSTETRATETATGAGSATLINSTEGVLYAEIAALANDGTFRMIGISDGTESNVVNFYYRTDANKITIRLKSGGSQVIFENFDITATNFSKIAFRYKSGESNLFIDGVKQKASDYTTTNMPSGLNELAFDSGGGGQFFYGKCKALAVFNEALSDSELTQLTT